MTGELFNIRVITTISCHVLLIFCVFANLSYAQEDLDSVLKGFDDPASDKTESAGSQPSSTSDEIDQLLEGFESTTPVGTPSKPSETELAEETPGLPSMFDSGLDPDRRWEYYADVIVDLSYNYAQKAPAAGQPDYRGLSRFRFKYQPELKWKIADNWESVISASAFYDFRYEINDDRNLYTHNALKEYESEIEIRDAYVRGSSDRVDLTVGRQIVVWGKSDNIRVVDILNPLDLREPGVVDIEDLRLPLVMTRLDYYMSDWSLTGITIHEIRFNKLPVYNNEYYPQSGPAPREEIPEGNAADTEFAIALNGIFSGWDLSFHWARIFDDRAYVEMISPGQFIQRHNRISMLGSAINSALGNWLVKGELARFDNVRYTNTPDRDYARVDSLLGLEYSGLTNTVLSLEIANRHVLGYADELEQGPDYIKQDNLQYALRYTGNFLHNRLEVILLSSRFGEKWEEGGFTRVSGNYEISAGLSVTLGVVTYHSGDYPRFSAISDNDRVFFETRYSY